MLIKFIIIGLIIFGIGKAVNFEPLMMMLIFGSIFFIYVLYKRRKGGRSGFGFFGKSNGESEVIDKGFINLMKYSIVSQLMNQNQAPQSMKLVIARSDLEELSNSKEDTKQEREIILELFKKY